MSYGLNKEWAAVENRTEKVGVGAYLTASAVTAVTTDYTRLLGTFSNIVLEGFIINGDDKLEYAPADGISRTFLLKYSGEVQGEVVNDLITIGIETGNGTLGILAGSETTVTCRTASSPYVMAKNIPITLDDGDTVEIQIKGDASFDATVNEFSTSLIKYF